MLHVLIIIFFNLTFQQLENNEHQGVVTSPAPVNVAGLRHVTAPITAPPSQTSANKSGLQPGQNICAECERLIVWVYHTEQLFFIGGVIGDCWCIKWINSLILNTYIQNFPYTIRCTGNSFFIYVFSRSNIIPFRILFTCKSCNWRSCNIT